MARPRQPPKHLIANPRHFARLGGAPAQGSKADGAQLQHLSDRELFGADPMIQDPAERLRPCFWPRIEIATWKPLVDRGRTNVPDRREWVLHFTTRPENDRSPSGPVKGANAPPWEPQGDRSAPLSADMSSRWGHPPPPVAPLSAGKARRVVRSRPRAPDLFRWPDRQPQRRPPDPASQRRCRRTA